MAMQTAIVAGKGTVLSLPGLGRPQAAMTLLNAASAKLGGLQGLGSVSHSLRASPRPALLRLGAQPARQRGYEVQSKYLGNAGQQTSDAASKAGHKAGQAAHKAGHAAENFASSTQESLEGAGARVQSATGASTGSGLSLLLCVALPVIIGAVISNSANNTTSSEWYQGLNKPSWNPPDWIFGLAWSVLYAIIGYSGYLVFQKGGVDAQSGPLTAYAIQLGLNFAWPIICFGAKNLSLALLDIVALAVSIYFTIKAFAPVDELAAKLLWPYLAWVIFAGALNYNLWRNNRNTPPGTTVRAAYS